MTQDWFGKGGMAFSWVAVAVVLAVVLVIAFRSGGGVAAGREESPEAILKRWYARGEIALPDPSGVARRLGNVRAVLSGHLLLVGALELAGQTFLCLGSVSGQQSMGPEAVSHHQFAQVLAGGGIELLEIDLRVLAAR